MIAGAIMGLAAYRLFLHGHPRDNVPARDRRLAPLRALAVVGIFAAGIAFFCTLYEAGVVLR